MELFLTNNRLEFEKIVKRKDFDFYLKQEKIVDKKQMSKIKEKVKKVIIKDEQNWSDLKDLEKNQQNLKSTMKGSKNKFSQPSDENINYQNTIKNSTFQKTYKSNG